MTERDTFLALHQRECQTTRRVISAFPPNELSFRPHERSRSAAELTFTLGQEELLFVQASKGIFDPSSFTAKAAPSTLDEILHSLDTNCALVQSTVAAASETDLNRPMNFAGLEMRRMDVMWAVLFDLIHHRGQLSVYVRMAGGKVPSIYGPSADDPGRSIAAAAKQS